MEFYYINAVGDRLGPVNADQLRALALQGIITPETIIKAGDKTLSAQKIKGLEFAIPIPEPPVVATPTKPNTMQKTPEHARRELIDAAESLGFFCGCLTFIARVEIIVGLIGGSFLIATANGDIASIAIGIATIFGGICAAIIPQFFATLGRYIIARDKNK